MITREMGATMEFITSRSLGPLGLIQVSDGKKFRLIVSYNYCLGIL